MFLPFSYEVMELALLVSQTKARVLLILVLFDLEGEHFENDLINIKLYMVTSIVQEYRCGHKFTLYNFLL